ncbi:unnamed protein product [Cercospora beticola]|nr:unnamed protein product [Cercospora beticola]
MPSRDTVRSCSTSAELYSERGTSTTPCKHCNRAMYSSLPPCEVFGMCLRVQQFIFAEFGKSTAQCISSHVQRKLRRSISHCAISLRAERNSESCEPLRLVWSDQRFQMDSAHEHTPTGFRVLFRWGGGLP